MSCAELPSVPAGDWFCLECTNRVAILADKVACFRKAIDAETTASAGNA